jgi:DinB superfamily
MSVDRSYTTLNEAQRARLEALVEGRSDADLGRELPGGWTVAGILAHLAFWDQRALILLERWEKEGAVPPPHNDADTDWINDAAKPMFLALPPRRAAELALSVAQAVDSKVATLGDELVARNVAAGTPVNLARATHRRGHLDEIDRALRRS